MGSYTLAGTVQLEVYLVRRPDLTNLCPVLTVLL